MESGTVSKWNVEEGSSFSAGDSLAVIETDKASMDFEAQDDGVVAKLLVSEGGGEINVGVPIIVTVEEADDVSAFANFVPEAGGGGEETTSAPEAEPFIEHRDVSPFAPPEDMPYHIVVGMPALSPTMEVGTISKWNVEEGSSFSAGDSLAVIETDKATIDYEAQDDGVVAKLLVEAGSGEVVVGRPIMVTVEDAADVAAFANFSVTNLSEDAPAAPEVVEPVKEEPLKVAVAPQPTPAPAQATLAPEVPPTNISAAPAVSLGGSAWGKLAAENSPLAKALASKQKQYIEKYGSTGHIPIV